MIKINSWLVVGVVVVITITSISGEIHRARNAPTYQYRIRKPNIAQKTHRSDPENVSPNPTATDDDSWGTWLDEKVWGHSRLVWLLSAISSGLVGVTGIIPLLVIPANCGVNFKSEASTNRMNALLSFAVGGLLGDVFLHLLPEAWSHVNDYGDHLYGYRQISLWFLGGLLSFYVVEKLCGGEDDDEDDEEEVEEVEGAVEEELEGGSEDSIEHEEKRKFAELIMSERKESINEIRNRKSQMKIINNGNNDASQEPCDRSEASRRDEGGLQLLKGTESGGANGGRDKQMEDIEATWMECSRVEVVEVVEEVEEDAAVVEATVGKKPDKIKVSGWLNLVANIIDNFTHGLAVAGSYCISPKMGLLTTFAILLHEVPHEIGDFAILLRAGFDRWRAAKAQLMTASGGFIGAMIALSAESVKSAGDSTAWILPFTAGGFVNIALVTIVPGLVKEKRTGQSLKQLFLVTGGILLMGLVTALVE